MPHEVSLQVRMPPELKRRIEQAAKEEHRSQSNLVRWVLEQWLDNR